MVEKLKQLNENVKAEWEIITPNLAAEILRKRNLYNRSLKKRTVDAYARDMENGNWRATGEPIVIDEKGILANGHHRLQAVLQSGQSIISLVVRGVSPESVDNMDQQAKRTAADVFTMNKIENAASVSSIVRTVLESRAGTSMRINGGSNYGAASITEIRDEYVTNKENYCWASKLSRKVNETNKLIAPKVIGALAYILLVDKKHPKKLVEDFFYQFADQQDFCTGVIRQLRQKLTIDAQSGQATKMSGAAKRYYLFKTWNLYATKNDQVLQGYNAKTSKTIELI